MDPLEPLKIGNFPGQIPITDEIQIQQKKLRKAAGEEDSSGSKTEDVFAPGEREHQLLPKSKYQTFLETARATLLKMDRNSSNFLPEATHQMVSSALEQEYGDEITKNPGYPQMEARLTRKILEDPHCRETMEKFLKLLEMEA
jgi:hypothetical protein